MSLPPLLLERLKRRGVIKDAPQNKSKEPEETIQKESSIEARYRTQESACINNVELEDQEEIIAEDYSENENEDETSESAKLSDQKTSATNEDRLGGQGDGVEDKEKVHLQLTESVLCCPNKYNIYHDCSKFCVDNYSENKDLGPTLEQRKQLALILRTYPISNEWTVVYDPGVKTFYFWNIISNLVSWLPPGMNGFVSASADQIRRAMKEMEEHKDNASINE